MPDTALITGGTGFVGRKISEALLAGGEFSLVLLYDIQPPDDALLPGERFVHGATQDQQCLQDCLLQHSPVSAVFHVAAYGMSGVGSLDRAKTWEVNVLGTRRVIAACVAASVPRLVYTSTCNVVFGGRPIRGGDESLPYYPPHKQVDCYSSSKTIAEMSVLAADGTLLAAAASGEQQSSAASGSGAAAGGQQVLQCPTLLRTCALRPNGIWGAGEQQHSVRLLSMAERHMLVATFGSASAVQDWTHIDNLVQAQVLAAAALTAAKGYVAAGQAYFITDPQPCNSTVFMQPLLEGLGYHVPRLRLPFWLMYCIACASECAYALLPRSLGVQPLITRNEVRKAAVTHFFSCEKAARELGYGPQQRCVSEYLPWFLERGYGPEGQHAGRLAGSKQQPPAAAAAVAAARVSNGNNTSTAC